MREVTNKIAIQHAILTSILPDLPMVDRFRGAKERGFDGVEIDLDGVSIDDVMDAVQDTGIEIAALNYGDASAILHPNPAYYDEPLEKLRLALTDASDLGAAGLVFSFAPTFPLPDSGEKSGAERAVDLLIEHLRWLEDYANAMNVTMFIQPRADSMLRTPAEIESVLARRNYHPRIKIALGSEHQDIDLIRPYAAHIGYVHCKTDIQQQAKMLHTAGYTGWVTQCSIDAD